MFFLGSQTRVTSDEQVVHGTLSEQSGCTWGEFPDEIVFLGNIYTVTLGDLH
jgi:hypothetical protein